MEIMTEMEKVFNRFSCSIVVDKEGTVIDLNKNFAHLVGNEKINSLFDLCWGQYDKDYYERILVHVSGGFSWRDEICFELEGYEPFWLDLAMVPYKENVMIVGIDATQRKKNESLIKDQQKQIFIQSQFSALGEMASGVAHEINNPLSIISASTYFLKELVKSEDLEPTIIEEIATDIDETVLRISRIIQGLRNIARDPSTDEFETVPLGKIFEDVIPLCNQKFKGRGIDLKLNFEEGFVSKTGDILTLQLSQVVLNLLNNAFDEIEEKGFANPWIEISGKEINDQVEIRVIDCGKGIPNDVQEKIFNPFFTQKEIGKGTGLGLSLSQSILKRHEGSIRIDNNCDNTCFVLEFPLSRGSSSHKREAA